MMPLCNKYVVYQCNDGVLEDCSMVKGNVRQMHKRKGEGRTYVLWHGTEQLDLVCVHPYLPLAEVMLNSVPVPEVQETQVDPETLKNTKELTTKTIITFDLTFKSEYYSASFEFYNVTILYSWCQRQTVIKYTSCDSSLFLFHAAQYEQHYSD